MNHGVIEQMDTPSAIYNHPKTEFIARFVGFENFLNLKKDGENYLAEDGNPDSGYGEKGWRAV